MTWVNGTVGGDAGSGSLCVPLVHLVHVRGVLSRSPSAGGGVMGGGSKRANAPTGARPGGTQRGRH